MWKFKRFSQTITASASKIIQDSSTTIDEKVYSGPPPPDRDVEFGVLTAVKTLYAAKPTYPEGPYNWVDNPPKTVSKKVAKAHDRVSRLPFDLLVPG